MYRELREENSILLEENKKLAHKKSFYLSECQKLRDLVEETSLVHQSLLDENRYLKQRLKELRHKTWFPVYEENLKLQQELDQYKTVLASVESFIGQYSNEKKGDKGCH
jgi:chromosome segregation ATPase